MSTFADVILEALLDHLGLELPESLPKPTCKTLNIKIRRTHCTSARHNTPHFGFGLRLHIPKRLVVQGQVFARSSLSIVMCAKSMFCPEVIVNLPSVHGVEAKYGSFADAMASRIWNYVHSGIDCIDCIDTFKMQKKRDVENSVQQGACRVSIPADTICSTIST